MTDDRRRALDAVLATLEAACDVVEEPWGTFVVNAEFHRIHMANFVWLRTLPPGGVPAVVHRMEEIFVPLRIPHRQWFVEDSKLAARIAPEMTGLGYTRMADHVMFARRPPRIAANPAVSVRPARDQSTRDDHDAIAGLLHEEDGYDHEVSHQLLTLNWRRQAELESEVFVAYLDGQPAGNVSFDAVGGAGELYEVETVPAMRRQGVAATMVLAMRARAEALGLNLFFLRTTVGHTTHEMYEKLGFDLEGTLDGFLLERRMVSSDRPTAPASGRSIS